MLYIMQCVIVSAILIDFTIARSHDMRLEFNPSHSAMRMDGHVFYKKTSTGPTRCSFECMTTRDCLSFNYEKEKRLCELNSENSTTAPGSLVAVDINHVFSDISVWPMSTGASCTSHNCSSLERCIPGPVCIVAFCTSVTPTVADATIDNLGVRALEDYRSYQCNTGYRMMGSHTIACLKDGSWATPQFTCIDINECVKGSHQCDPNASCDNTVGSYTCTCNPGWLEVLFGWECNDANECQDGTDSCHANAGCTNTAGSYYCTCSTGYSGDGWSCSDVNECTVGSHGCDANGACGNTIGTYMCTCNTGYSGTGWSCSDVNECTSGGHTCTVHQDCVNTIGSFTCTCISGSAGCYELSGEGVRLCDGNGCGSPSSSRGRVEVLMNGAWGSVCDDGWETGSQWRDQNIAMVCKMFGHSGGTMDDSGLPMVADADIWMDSVQCPEYNSLSVHTIFNCVYTSQHNCVHQEDVFVMCS